MEMFIIVCQKKIVNCRRHSGEWIKRRGGRSPGPVPRTRYVIVTGGRGGGGGTHLSGGCSKQLLGVTVIAACAQRLNATLRASSYMLG